MSNPVLFQGKSVYKKPDRVGEEGRLCAGLRVSTDTAGGGSQVRQTDELLYLQFNFSEQRLCHLSLSINIHGRFIATDKHKLFQVCECFY